MFAPVATRFQTYGVPVDGRAQEFYGRILEHPHVGEWLEAGKAERAVIPLFGEYSPTVGAPGSTPLCCGGNRRYSSRYVSPFRVPRMLRPPGSVSTASHRVWGLEERSREPRHGWSTQQQRCALRRHGSDGEFYVAGRIAYGHPSLPQRGTSGWGAAILLEPARRGR